jgi:TATA-box binding protein (TBP) (component of TFIID and TFIIIB)
VLILRLKVGLNFKEFHVKVFNTGKLEIPGVQNEETFKSILSLIIITLQPFVSDTLFYKENSAQTVLINSNFNCGFFINREVLYDILRNKYNIQSIYDPCSYPGIQCKFYYNHDLGIQKGCQISEENKLLYKNISQISFMIFRTGSVLIVGKCDEDILMTVYNFLKQILYDEYEEIFQKTNSTSILSNSLVVKDKKKKIRKKIITVDLVEKPN